MSTYIPHVVMQGDTLQRLAVKYNVSSWQNIAYANDLVYPFIIDEVMLGAERQPNVKYIGDTLIIPANGVEDINFISGRELQRRTFGVDLKLSLESDVNGVNNLESQGQLSNNAMMDLELVLGAENLKQSLIRRLTTRYGELPLHPEYGSEFLDLLGKKRTHSNLVKMKLAVQEAFLSDKRVSSIQNCKLRAYGTAVLITCDIITVNPQAIINFSSNTSTWEV